MDSSLFTSVKEMVDDIPAIDIHTHLGTGGIWQARDLGDIVFYHWLAFELRCAGYPGDLRDRASDLRKKVWEALSYSKMSFNTANHFAFKGIIRHLYGIDVKTLNESNYEKVFDTVQEMAQDQSWEREVLKRANVERASVEYRCEPRSSEHPYFTYAREEPIYGVGLYTTQDFHSILGKEVRNSHDLDVVITSHIGKLARDHGIKAYHVWLPYSWRYLDPSGYNIDEVVRKWSRGAQLSEKEKNLLSSFSADVCAREAARHAIVIQLFHGSRSYGGGPDVSVWEPEWIRTLIAHVAKNQRTKFEIFLATRNASHEVTVLCRMYPNMTASGAWWHGFTPQTLLTFFRDRLELLPYTKWSAFYSDAYCVEWVFGKLLLVRNRLSVALTQIVEEGLLDKEDVYDVAKAVLYDNPREIYSVS